MEGTTKKDQTLYCNPLVSGRRVKSFNGDLGDGSLNSAPGSISLCERRWAKSSGIRTALLSNDLLDFSDHFLNLAGSAFLFALGLQAGIHAYFPGDLLDRKSVV